MSEKCVIGCSQSLAALMDNLEWLWKTVRLFSILRLPSAEFDVSDSVCCSAEYKQVAVARKKLYFWAFSQAGDIAAHSTSQEIHIQRYSCANAGNVQFRESDMAPVSLAFVWYAAQA